LTLILFFFADEGSAIDIPRSRNRCSWHQPRQPRQV